MGTLRNTDATYYLSNGDHGNYRYLSLSEIIDSFRENFAAYKLTADDSMVKLACSTMIDMGIKPTLETTGGGTDANVFNKHGIPCVVVGMGTNDMHTVREYVKIDELEEVAQFCLNLISKK